LYYLLILFLPTQLGKHFWPNFSFVLGSRIDYLSPTLYTTDILLIALLAFVFLRKRIHIHPYFSSTILFISFSIFFSQSTPAGWYWLAKFLEMSFLVWYVKNTPNKIVVGLLLACGVIFESILSIVQIFHQGSLGGVLYFFGERSFVASTPGIANASVAGELVLRPYGTFSHPNMLAGYFVITMLFVAYFLARSNKALQVILFSSLIFGTIGLTLTLSRTSILAWILVGLIGIAITFHKRISRNILILCSTIGTAFLLSIVFFPPIIFRLLSFSFGESFVERIGLAQSAMKMIVTHPLFGVGPNNFISSLSFFSKNSFVLQPVHNVYLLVAAELGLPGLLLFCGFLWTLIKKFYFVWRKSLIPERNRQLPLALALFAILFSAFFDHYFLTLQQGQLLFAICIGLIFREVRSAHGTIRK